MNKNSRTNSFKKILLKNKFEHIVELDKFLTVANWDYHCEKNNIKWLIKIISGNKTFTIEEIINTVHGYKHAILLKKDKQWHFIEVKFKEDILK